MDTITLIAPFALLISVIVLGFILWNWRRRHFDYQCEKCSTKFSLPFLSGFISIQNITGGKYVICPGCGKWSWAKPIPKQ